MKRLSVIVPVFNGADALGRCLDALAASDFKDYECIVVDDASTEPVRVPTELGVTVLRLDRQGGPARARNHGAMQSNGEILAFIDADACVHRDTLGRIDEHLRTNRDAAAVLGSYDDTPADQGFLSQYKNLFHHYVHQRSSERAWTFWAGCGAIRRQAFLDLHGFDESYARPSIEDIELGFRLRAADHRIDLNPTIQVTHLKRWTFWSLLRTDVCDRAIPWLLLMLKARTMPPDLNVTIAHRLSVVLVWAMLLLSGVFLLAWEDVAPVRTAGVLLLATMSGALFLLNLDLYRFLTRRHGLWFAARAIPLHWLYYGYCGLAVGLAVPLHLWRLARRNRQATEAQSA